MKFPVPVTGFAFQSPLGSSLEELTESLECTTTALSCTHRFADWISAPLCELSRKDLSALQQRVSLRSCHDQERVGAINFDGLLVEMGRDVLGRLLADSRVLDRVPAQKVGIFLGTSTAGVERTLERAKEWENAGRSRPENFFNWTHQHGLLESVLRHEFGLNGPGCTFATACSSAALAIAEAARAIDSGVVDAAVAGGFDVLSLMTILGFSAMQILSPRGCRPLAADADGISLGEGGALLLLESPLVPGVGSRTLATLNGWGASSDGHHITQPHPEGKGMSLAMAAALESAGLSPGRISYVNAHGTGTQHNDAAETLALAHVFRGERVRVSSTKGAHGHLLGAAGALESVVCLAALQSQTAFAGASLVGSDPRPLGAHLAHAAGERCCLDFVMSNSFGFGGSNASLIFGRASAAGGL